MGDSIILSNPKINILNPENALKYFNKDLIIREELKNEEILSLFLEDSSIHHAIRKIFLKAKKDAGKYQQSLLDMEESHDASMFKKLRKSSSTSSISSVGFSSSESVDEEVFSPGSSQDRNQSKLVHGDSKVDLSSVFYLMSILPDSEATECKRLIDEEPSWTPTLYNIVLVFLNWGVCKKNLGLEDFSHHTSKDCSSRGQKFSPTSSNVCLVLETIATRITVDSMDDRDKIMLIKCLVIMSLDAQIERNREFVFAITAVIDSFLIWDDNLMEKIVESLELEQMDVQNAAHVSCNVLNLNSERTIAVGSCAAKRVVENIYKSAGFSELQYELGKEPSPSTLIAKLKFTELFALTQLLAVLVARQAFASPPCKKEQLQSFELWCENMRVAILPIGWQAVDVQKVEERLTRCKAAVRSYSQMIFG